MSNRTKAPLSLSMFQGERRTFSIQAWNNTTDQPYDLTGKTLRFVVFDGNTPPSAWFKAESSDGITINTIDSTIADVTIAVAKTDAATVSHNWLLWDVTGDVDRELNNGTIKVKPAVKDVA